MFTRTSIGSRYALRARGIAITNAAFAAAILSVCSSGARADALPGYQTPASDQKNSAVLVRDLNAFISSAIVRYHDQAFARWPLAIPVCLRVSGIESSERDLVIARIYEIAQAAGARIGDANCDPSFFVFVTPQPDAIMAAMRKRNPRLFNIHYGVDQVNRFMNTPRPIRAWYNTYIGGGVPNSKLQYDETRAITQVFVFIDTKRLGDTVNFRQLADYTAMVGLAEVNLDNDLGDAPTILHLFGANAEARKPGLTSWDQAVLYSLYNMPRKDVLQVDEMANSAARYITQSP
jgi:hypothetical protein